MMKSRRYCALVGAGLATLSLAACGSSSTGGGSSTATGSGGSGVASSATSTQSAATGSTPSGVSGAAAALQPFTGLPTFKAPGPKINAASIMKGKAILAIPVISSNPFTTGLEAEQAALAKQIGFRYIRWNNNGTIAEWTKGIQYGIAQKVSLIALDGGVQPKLLGPVIKQAQAAGIVVVDTHETADAQGKSPSVDFTIPAPYAQAGQLMADYAIAQDKGKVDGLIISSPDVIGSPPFVNAIKAEFAKRCPSCKTSTSDVTVANWASGIGPAVTGAIERDPNLNFILPLYDPEVEYVLPALRQAHKTQAINISTYAGTAFVLKDIAQGLVGMDVGEANVGYSMLDDEMRLIAKMKPAFPEYLAVRAFTKSNIGSGSGFADYGSNATEKSWLSLWGLS